MHARLVRGLGAWPDQREQVQRSCGGVRVLVVLVCQHEAADSGISEDPRGTGSRRAGRALL